MKQNRKEILKTIFKLFLTRHYEDVSYDDMIKATNISKGGLYHYAPNKIELFRLVVDTFFLDLIKVEDDIMIKTSGSDKFALHDFLMSYASFLHKRFCRIQDFLQLPVDETARRKNEKGEWSGGAMYYLTDGLGAKKGCKQLGKVLAVLFACFCILASFGIGNMSQINSIAGNMNAAFGVPTLVTGLCLMVVTALIVIGGLKRVAAVTEKLVPLMALFYIAGALIIVVLHAGNIPAAFAAIFKGAFNLNAAGGGALGYGISQTITWGFKRGAFSNEAGLGSAVMVNSASNVKEPVHQGMWGVFEVFADTIVVCTLTALVILTTGVVDLQSGAVLAGVQDNALVGQAFTAAFGSFGPKFIAISILLFAYSTTLGWSHYGTKAVEYLFGTTGSRIYKVVFVCMTVVGATMKLGLAWDLSDTFNGLMMIPNLIGVLVLSGTVVDITRNYFDRRVKGKDIEPMWSAFLEYQKQEEAEAAAEEAELEKAANE